MSNAPRPPLAGSPPTTVPHSDYVVSSGKGDAFHVVVFGGTDAEAAGAVLAPVVLCVHGAGMSAASFFTLAPFLTSSGEAFEALKDEWYKRAASPYSESGENAAFGSSMPSHSPSAAAGSTGAPTVVSTSASLPPSGAIPPRPVVSVVSRSLVRPNIPLGDRATAVPGSANHHQPPHAPHVPSHPVLARDPAPLTALAPAQEVTAAPVLPYPAHLMDKEDEDYLLRVASFDMRCHGESTYHGGEASLTIQQLVEDFVDVFSGMRAQLFPRTPRFYIVGHSLGGAVVSRALAEHKELRSFVGGVALLDIVEGTAKLSLRFMDDFLVKRPTSFGSVSEATRWFVNHGGMRTPSSAAISVPPLLKTREDGRWEWKTRLAEMKSVWGQWFEGMDENFVGLPCPKILCLATTERLDKDLTVAQMQGKFQLEIIGNGSGHYLMDDAPVALAVKLKRFARRIETLLVKLKVKQV